MVVFYLTFKEQIDNLGVISIIPGVPAAAQIKNLTEVAQVEAEVQV